MPTQFPVSIGVAIVMALVAASSASASRESGDACVANTVETNRTMIPFDNGRLGMNRTIVEGGIGEGGDRGVVTGWKVRVGLGQHTLPQRLEIYRAVNDSGEFRQEAQTPLEMVQVGENSFPARIPVLIGAHLGLYGSEGTFACTAEEPVVSGAFEGSANVGEVRKVTDLFGLRTPVTVIIERDEDGDGYGDETQDGCTEYASIQTACPFVRLTPSITAVTKRAILLDVSTGDPTQVQVSGQVGWRVQPTPRAHAVKRVVIVLSGGTQEVPAGATVAFTVPLPKAVKRRLGKLEPKGRLKAKLRVISTDLVGHQTLSCLIVRLPGPGIVVTKGLQSCPAATLPG